MASGSEATLELNFHPTLTTLTIVRSGNWIFFPCCGNIYLGFSGSLYIASMLVHCDNGLFESGFHGV
jgi:hypothetical protein